MDYQQYGQKWSQRIQALLKLEGLDGVPSKYETFMELDYSLRSLIGYHLPLVLSDNYEHFMACLPGKAYAAQHVLIRKQIGGFTVAAGYWKWLEFLSHQISREEVELVADFFSGKENGHPRQFNKDYWLHVVDDFNGYLPLRITYPGEGAVFTGVPFPIAQVYGETPAVWLNEPMYIQAGHLTYVATIAAQFAEVLGDPWRFIEVAFRALQGKEIGPDLLLAMLIGGGIISTSNDLGAFIHGAPFKPSGTTGHCFYQQWEAFKESLRKLLGSDLGPFATVLLDINEHKHGFRELLEVLAEGYPAPFADRPDSGDTLKLGMHDLTVLEDQGKKINVVFEDGKRPADMLEAERVRRQNGLSAERTLYGAGGAFVGQRRDLEAAYKACYFHNGSPTAPTDVVETMKICLDDPMKQSLPGMIHWFQNPDTGFYMMGEQGETPPDGYVVADQVLYDGLSDPGNPHFNSRYDANNLTNSTAIRDGQEWSKTVRQLLGPSFTHDVAPNRNSVAMTKALRDKRTRIHQRALQVVAS